ncbi:hypothetical protein AMTRI_Chr11g151380 [Amborella trichopoda]
MLVLHCYAQGPPCIAPMKYYGHTQPSRCLGVVGLGGLGHIAVKFVKAYLLKVTGISTSPIKDKEAMERLKVEKFLVSRDSEQMKLCVISEGPRGGVLCRCWRSLLEMATSTLRRRSLKSLLDPKAAMGTLDCIQDTVSAYHELVPLLNLIKPNGKLFFVGVPEKPYKFPAIPLLIEERIDFYGRHNIMADVEVIKMDFVNTGLEKLAKANEKLLLHSGEVSMVMELLSSSFFIGGKDELVAQLLRIAECSFFILLLWGGFGGESRGLNGLTN